MFKLCIFNKNVLILSMVLNFLLSGNTFAFADDKDILIFNNDYFLDSSSKNQSNKNESATISSTNFLNSKSQNVNLRSAHKYLGYATAALSGITAASFSSKGFHDDTPHLCSPLVIKFLTQIERSSIISWKKSIALFTTREHPNPRISS